ncbi:DUF4132 domain-containing protein [Novosphingobium resinovorum]|uniref:DUF4132 domain-containing protein n=1 Tax=Novosphingobium resinovorum TaxID=158500 RepID=UPI002ED4FB29|nr:DUF4132 domain-containing protein [Novosphingobium resinovorum]
MLAGLNRAGSAFSSDPTTLPVGAISAFFKELSKAGRGLPEAAARYVADGENSSVLATLQGSAARQVWGQRARIWPPRDEEGLFTRLDVWRIDQMQRFGEVLAALQPLSHDWGMFGTRASPDWLRHVVTIWLGHGRKDQPVETLAALAASCTAPAANVIDIVFCHDAANYGARSSVARFAGVGAWLDAEHDAVVAAMPALGADTRSSLAASIGHFGLQDRFLGMLLDLATGSSKKARASARQALTACDRAALAAALDARFAEAAPGQRAELVEVAAASLAGAAADLVARWREAEKAPKVLAAIERVSGAVAQPIVSAETEEGAPAGAIGDGPGGYRAIDGSWVAADPAPPPAEPGPVSAEVLKLLEPAAAEFNRLLAKGQAEAAVSGARWHWSRQFSRKGASELKALARIAEGTAPMVQSSYADVVGWLRWHQFKHPAVEEFFQDPRLSLHHLVRLGAALCNCHINGLLGDWSGPVGPAILRRLQAGADFRAFHALWLANGGNDYLADHLVQRWYGPLPDLDVPVWPLLCSRFEAIDQALGMAAQSDTEPKRTLPGLDLLALFPKVPERYRTRLMLLAGDSSRRLREKARGLLQDAPGIDGAIAAQLQDGRQEVRALAAEWLADRRAAAEAGAIRAALKKERSDLARAAMITALERMGEDVSACFDPDALLKEARAGLAKAAPKGLDWFLFDHLPALQWADGSPVDPLLPRWWIVLACKLRQPGGNALVNLWLDRLAPGHAHRLGWMVLTCWIDEDTRRPSDEEANAYAAQHVDAQLKNNIANARRWPQSADYFPTDRTVLFAQLKRSKAGEYLSSAVDSKGVLALASRVAGVDAAQRIRPFLKEHGARTSQAKALLDVLGAIGSSAALQLVLSAANRSKQRSVQTHAAALVEAVAERNGWSAAQLADRTVPTGGFDADGTQDLDLGQGRTYRLQFDESDAIVILNPEGREVKALPGPRVDAEKPEVDAAKKQLSAARKEVKQVLAAQIERLREAMFLQRAWECADWEAFIAGHPVVGRIAARLVWQGHDAEGRAIGTFRPLGDGSHTDAADGDVDVGVFAEVRLAHSSLLGAGDEAAWQRHLADYAVTPPFAQFGRALPVIAGEQKRLRTITDREGWMIETFKLRGIAGKLGYQRGPAQDGGWFLTYEKSYREAGLMAEIEFTGSPLPEENRPAALLSLGFRRLRGAGAAMGGQVALEEVPPVLLAETWRDLHDMADKGSGFDPDWQKKGYA